MLNQGSHPLNLGIRFLLEITVLIVVGMWGFASFNGFYSYSIGLGSPLILATLWGVFAVPNDPSRSGKTVIKTSGRMRLLLELSFFILGASALYSLNYTNLFYAFSIISLLHYLMSMDRIKWLIAH